MIARLGLIALLNQLETSNASLTPALIIGSARRDQSNLETCIRRIDRFLGRTTTAHRPHKTLRWRGEIPFELCPVLLLTLSVSGVFSVMRIRRFLVCGLLALLSFVGAVSCSGPSQESVNPTNTGLKVALITSGAANDQSWSEAGIGGLKLIALPPH